MLNSNFFDIRLSKWKKWKCAH